MLTLTVYFADPWWVGALEVEEDCMLRVHRHVFGSEPSNEDVLAFVLQQLQPLLTHPVVGIAVAPNAPHRVNPKRAAREAAQQTNLRGINTKSQEAMRVVQETQKQERKQLSREERGRIADYKREMARARAYARKRGH